MAETPRTGTVDRGSVRGVVHAESARGSSPVRGASGAAGARSGRPRAAVHARRLPHPLLLSPGAGADFLGADPTAPPDRHRPASGTYAAGPEVRLPLRGRGPGRGDVGNGEGRARRPASSGVCRGATVAEA